MPGCHCLHMCRFSAIVAQCTAGAGIRMTLKLTTNKQPHNRKLRSIKADDVLCHGHVQTRFLDSVEKPAHAQTVPRLCFSPPHPN